MVSLIVEVLHEAFNLQFQFTRQVVVLQVDHDFDRPVVTLNLALCLGMVAFTSGMCHLPVFEVFLQLL